MSIKNKTKGACMQGATVANGKKGGILNNTMTDPNKILPMTYLWARQHYKDGVANNWTPEEVSMQKDVEQWKSSTALTEHERKLVLWNLGFFSTAESLTANNIIIALYRHVTNPECRQYMLRQAFEEAVHTDTFIYCCDSLGLDPDYIYNMYQTIPSIKAKDDFVVNMTLTIFDPTFEAKGFHNIQRFVLDLIGYYVIMEGIFFYAGFAMMLALKRQQKMMGIGEQFEYIMRDESIHLAFGCDLINTIKAENPEIWDAQFQAKIVELIKEAVRLEKQYALDACPQGLLGINAQQFSKYVEYIADRRFERLGFARVYGTENPLPWMAQSTDLSKEKNFFETRVTEYQTAGSLKWD
jgi:ribonucleoside-diphosphate reductase beta chain